MSVAPGRPSLDQLRTQALNAVRIPARRISLRPSFTGADRNFDPDEAGDWFSYFHTAAVTGQLAWSAGPFVPVAEAGLVIRCDRLAGDDADCAPDRAPDLAAMR